MNAGTLTKANGPTEFTSQHFRIVYDYVGSFNLELPDHHFDFVFSISALEHTPEEEQTQVNVLADINRVMKPGCPSFHCFDAILRPAGNSWVNGLIPYIYATQSLKTHFVPLAEIEADPDTYFMSQQAYEANWQPFTYEPYEKFGQAFSINLCWTAA